MKTLYSILIFCLFAQIGWAGELKHIIRDGEFWYKGIFEERASCIEEEHLFINLSEEDWNRICDTDISFRRVTHFSAQLCIKCRLIEVACCGNDWYRYAIEKLENK